MTRDISMPDLSCGIGEEDVTRTPMHASTDEEHSHNNSIHHSDEDELNEEAWEIRVTTEMKHKLTGPWQTSIILKLIGRQLGYRALQTKLVGI